MRNANFFSDLILMGELGYEPDAVLIGDAMMYYLELSWDDKPFGVQLIRSSSPTMLMPLKLGGSVPPLHASGAGSFLECGRAWFYRDSNWGLGYKIADNPKMAFGNWWHYATALMAGAYSWREAFIATLERQDDMEELLDFETDQAELDKLEHLLFAHQEWQKEGGSYSDKELVYLSAEKTFEVEIDGVLVHGQWDAIVRHIPTRQLYVLERKTTGSPDHLEQGLLNDLQPRVYALAAEAILGEPVRGVIYEIVKNTDPCAVTLLKNGLPSKAQKELDSTTYEVYKKLLDECIKQTGKDVVDTEEKYDQALSYLKHRTEGAIFRRTLVVVSDHMKQATREQLLQLRTNMLVERFGNGSPLPNLRRHRCPYCPFRMICLSHDEGWGYEAGLEAQFKRDVPRFDETLGDWLDAEV